MPRFGVIPDINFCFLVWKLIATAIVVIQTFSKRRKLNTLDALLLLYCLIIILSTKINEGSVVDVISDSLAIVVPIFTIELYIKRLSLKQLVLPMVVLFSLYTTITAIQLLNVPFYIFHIHGLRDSYSNLYIDQYGSIFALGNPKRFVFMILPLIVYTLMYEKYRTDIEGRRTTNMNKIMTVYVWGVSLFCLFYSWSTSAMLAVIIILLFYYFYSSRIFSNIWKYINGVIIFIGYIIINILLLFSSFIGVFKSMLELLGKDTSLSGRTYIWAKAFAFIIEKPLIGYGVNNELTASRFSGLVHLHNYLLNCTYIGGVLLLACVIIMLFIIGKSLSEDIQENVYVRILLLGFTGFLIIALTDTPDYNMLYMLFPFMYLNNQLTRANYYLPKNNHDH